MRRLLPFVAVTVLAVALAGCAGGRDSLEDMALEKPEQLEKLVDEIVTDADRNARAKSLLEELDRTILIYFRQVEEVQLATVHAGLDREASSADLRAIQANLGAARRARRDDMIALSMQAREVLTAEEWTELAQRRLEAADEMEGGTR